jgi:hypothetical protein
MATTSLIDAEHDDLVPVRKLAQKRLGKMISRATQWRWVRGKGARGGRLTAVKILNVWHTTEIAFAAFITNQTAAALGNDAPVFAPAERSSASRSRNEQERNQGRKKPRR